VLIKQNINIVYARCMYALNRYCLLLISCRSLPWKIAVPSCCWLGERSNNAFPMTVFPISNRGVLNSSRCVLSEPLS